MMGKRQLILEPCIVVSLPDSKTYFGNFCNFYNTFLIARNRKQPERLIVPESLATHKGRKLTGYQICSSKRL